MMVFPQPYVEFMRQALARYYGQLPDLTDFTTAPEISPLFGQTLASACAEILRAPQADLLEFGPGSGRLAASLLTELARLDALPRHYYLLEPSPSLRQRQTRMLHAQLPPNLAQRLVWLERLPDPFRGVILANEVLDALPVELFEVTAEDWHRGYVVAQADGSLELAYRPDPDLAFQAACARLRNLQSWPVGYRSEFAPLLPAWMATAAAILETGALVISDYGDTWPERYHPGRHQGSLRAYAQHRLVTNVLAQPGAQDLTADVDFSVVLASAQAAGLHVAHYGTQAQFLLKHGILDRLQQQDPQDTVSYLRLAQQVKTLLLPDEMGERFKVAWLTRPG